jgi:hypothetical protein
MLIFVVLVWLGAALTLVGLGMLVWCIVSVAKARRAGLAEDALKARLQKIVALNLAALGVSGLGLATVILGIVLA